MPWSDIPKAVISIHAPHEGERLIFFLCFSCVFYFNPRSPRGGATLCHMSFQSAYKTFQSTLPTRGSDQNIYKVSYFLHQISIHAPHEGERPKYIYSFIFFTSNFNPRSPRGGATLKSFFVRRGLCISIHAPHEGERHISSLSLFISHLISIHAPHEGERRTKTSQEQSHKPMS